VLATTPLQAAHPSRLGQLLATASAACSSRHRVGPTRTLRTSGDNQQVRRDRVTKRAFPEIGSTIDHLREVLGDEAYEALASTGASMTNAAMTAIGEEVDFRQRSARNHADGRAGRRSGRGLPSQ
jgi:hypothetical protein